MALALEQVNPVLLYLCIFEPSQAKPNHHPPNVGFIICPNNTLRVGEKDPTRNASSIIQNYKDCSFYGASIANLLSETIYLNETCFGNNQYYGLQ